MASPFLEDGFTVLLYYQYCPIQEPSRICKWQEELCERLHLGGRVRVSEEGLNGTVAGQHEALQEYMEEFQAFPELFPDSIHWKLSKAVSRYDLEDQKFQSLSCKVTKEVVSLDLPGEEREKMIAAGPGEHLSPQQFHDAISAAVASKEKDQLVLIDVRNIYETEIGRFQCPEGVPVLDPKTRKFKDFTDFIDTHKDDLKSKQVLMYCTGGVRCERASSYLKLRGINNVSQLSGGIHSYQELFPSGDGYFRGKNFVFDPRIAVPNKNRDEVVGTCRLCREPYDDYKPQVRCQYCRMLQLVCDTCRVKVGNGQRDNEGSDGSIAIVCELCESKGRGELPNC